MLLNPCRPTCAQGCQCCAGDSGADLGNVDITLDVTGLPTTLTLWFVTPLQGWPVGAPEYGGWYVEAESQQDVEQAVKQSIADHDIRLDWGLVGYAVTRMEFTLSLNGNWISRGAEVQHSRCVASWVDLGGFVDAPADLCHIEGLAYRDTEHPITIQATYWLLQNRYDEDNQRYTTTLEWQQEYAPDPEYPEANAIWFAIWYDPSDPDHKQRGVYVYYELHGLLVTASGPAGWYGGLESLIFEGAEIEDDVDEAYTCDALDVTVTPDPDRWEAYPFGTWADGVEKESVIDQGSLSVHVTSEVPEE